MTITAIIVNYKVPQFLLQCIDSLRVSFAAMHAADARYNGEIVVVDNNSQDGSQQLVATYFPEVRYIALSENLGFAKANNIAIRQSESDYVALVNPDVIVSSSTMLEMVRFMEEHRDAGAVGPRIINIEGMFLPESKRNYPTMWVAFCKLTRLSRVFSGSPLFDCYYNCRLGERECGVTDILVGAFIFMDRRRLGDVALLDEDFFMYGEDIDISVRIKEAGFNNYYLPSTIIHYKGESTNKDCLRYISSFYGAMRIFCRKHSRSKLIYGFVSVMVWVIQKLLQMKPRSLTASAGVVDSVTLRADEIGYDRIIEYVEQNRGKSQVIISNPRYNLNVYGLARG